MSGPKHDLRAHLSEGLDFVNENKSGLKPNQLKKKLRAKHGLRENPFLVRNYAHACPLGPNCPDCSSGKKICITRAEVYADYIRNGHGDTIPLMKDFLAKLMMEKDAEEVRWRKRGLPPTKEWLKLNEQSGKMMEIVHRAEKGIKIQSDEPSFLEQMQKTILIDTPEGRMLIQRKEPPKGNVPNSLKPNRSAEEEIF